MGFVVPANQTTLMHTDSCSGKLVASLQRFEFVSRFSHLGAPRPPLRHFAACALAAVLL